MCSCWNKSDALPTVELERLAAVLATFNPRARMVAASHGRVPLDTVLGTGLFDLAAAHAAPGWSQALAGAHLPESEEFGITNFVYRARRPFHPARFHDWINGDLPGVIRAKGFFWLASRMDWAGSWHLAGAVGRHEAGGHWFAAVPVSRWPTDPDWRETVRKLHQGEFGDRRQELVFIGIGMDEANTRAGLERCLLTDDEFATGPRSWSRLPDPFPVWGGDDA